MSLIDEHNKGFSGGLAGQPLDPTASMAETQAHQLGDNMRKSNETSRWTGYSERVENILKSVSSAFALLFFAIGAVNGYLGAQRLEWGVTGQLLCALLLGGAGIGLGFAVPRIVMGLFVLTRIALQFALVLAVILLLYLLYFYATRALH